MIESLQWIRPSRIGQTCVPWGQSVPSHSHDCFGSAVLRGALADGRADLADRHRQRHRPGSAPSTAIGPVSGLL